MHSIPPPPSLSVVFIFRFFSSPNSQRSLSCCYFTSLSFSPNAKYVSKHVFLSFSDSLLLFHSRLLRCLNPKHSIESDGRPTCIFIEIEIIWLVQKKNTQQAATKRRFNTIFLSVGHRTTSDALTNSKPKRQHKTCEVSTRNRSKFTVLR